MCSGDFRGEKVFRRRKNWILPLRCDPLNGSPEVVHRPRSQSRLHFDIRNTQQIRSEKQLPSAWRLLFAVLLERWPQVCRVKITFTKLLTNRFVSTTKISMKCVVNWIQLKIRVQSRYTQPHFKIIGGLRSHLLLFLLRRKKMVKKKH